MKYNRKSIRYRVTHWLNGITMNDIKRVKSAVLSTTGEIMTVLLMLFCMFILPHIFG